MQAGTSYFDAYSSLPEGCNTSDSFYKWSLNNSGLDHPPDCVDNYTDAVNLSNCCSFVKNCNGVGNCNCSQFCKEFTSLPFIYLGVSVVSALCCSLVFLTYLCLPRLRQTGYSSKVFLNR